MQNPYAGDSPILARCFLLRPRFANLTTLQEFAIERTWLRSRGSERLLSLATAPKVVQALVEEFVVVKGGDEGVALADPRRLLDNLRQKYRLLSTRRLIGKSPLAGGELWSRLERATK